MVAAAPRLAAAGGVDLTHQTGERDLELVRAAYERERIAARVEPFLFDMDREMSRADVLVCRAGATTIFEVAAIGRPAILIPLPTAADNHQLHNAEVLAKAGAAEVIEQKELTGERLADRVIALAHDADRRRAMAQAVRTFARPDAAKTIVDKALELCRGTRGTRGGDGRGTRGTRGGDGRGTRGLRGGDSRGTRGLRGGDSRGTHGSRGTEC
jgi:UDP-N-acetylglucosamine--N-acetylmuramyl-(pentapeptide) pyrophosphoryl-undecaprenol N-acetylglucosamine transferase